MERKIELLKSIPGVKVIAVFGDRVYFAAPPQAVMLNTPFKKVRAGACDNAVLARSMKKVMLYPPILHGEINGGKLELQVVDGSQRVLSSLENRVETMTFQMIFFNSQSEAIEAAISANAIRHEPTDVDILSQFRTGISLNRMMEITMVSETVLRRLEKISRHSGLDEAVRKKYFTVGQIASALEKCKGDYEREKRLVVYLKERIESAKKIAAEAQGFIDKRKGRKIDATQRKKAEVASHLKDIPWADLKTELARDDQDGPLAVAKSEGSGLTTLRAGDSQEWEKGFSIYGGEGTPWEKIAIDDLTEFRKALPDIQKKIEAVIKRKQQEIAPPLPTSNPDAAAEEELEVEDQEADFTAGDEDFEDGVDE